MADQREGSMMFSLRGLFDVERPRPDEEERARRDAALAEEQARAQVLFVARLAEEERSARVLRERALVAEREREHAAMLAARQQAEVERARVQAQAAAKLAETEAHLGHERAMARARLAAGGRVDRGLAVGGLVFGLGTTVLAAVVYLGALHPATERSLVSYQRLVAAERERGDLATRQLQLSEERREALARKVAELQAELSRGAAPGGAPASSTPVGAGAAPAPRTARPGPVGPAAPR